MYRIEQLKLIISKFKAVILSYSQAEVILNSHKVFESIVKFQLILKTKSSAKSYDENLKLLVQLGKENLKYSFYSNNFKIIDNVRKYRNKVAHEHYETLTDFEEYLPINLVEELLFDYVTNFFRTEYNLVFSPDIKNHNQAKLLLSKLLELDLIELENNRLKTENNGSNAWETDFRESYNKGSHTKSEKDVDNSINDLTSDIGASKNNSLGVLIFIGTILVIFVLYELLVKDNSSSDDFSATSIDTSAPITSNNTESDNSIQTPNVEQSNESNISTTLNEVPTKSSANENNQTTQITNSQEPSPSQKEYRPELVEPTIQPNPRPPCELNQTGDLRITNKSNIPKTVKIQVFVRSERLGGDYYDEIRSPTTIQPGKSITITNLKVGYYQCYFIWGGSRPGTILPANSDSRDANINQCSQAEIECP